MTPPRTGPPSTAPLSTRPPHLRPGAILLVAAGGAVGTAARYGTALVLPPLGAVPVATIAVNLVGAFLLGLLLAGLARRGPDTGGRLTLRLLLGTGVLGGFTTYSTFSLDTVTLLEGGRWADGVLYTGVTLVLGTLAAALGVVLAGRRRSGAIA
ncbi:fluoride efflux transporter CrcB [Rathayibacter sp. VKM Ac-2927]|uniref:fluoride efflux transporter CrcB n=1 Tax=Rathayibacter sp. VKM Ac-2927 TaxID=2929478 RepID=UPI001FB30688|nr:fluoride efflux transporter CrcB [Rathayibacter sp. VKM Ac-2927]MCJ1689259.1 fluoride efflux transporter CrcB [Rathayibacter sp. VKM Ac-2927]